MDNSGKFLFAIIKEEIDIEWDDVTDVKPVLLSNAMSVDNLQEIEQQAWRKMEIALETTAVSSHLTESSTLTSLELDKSTGHRTYSCTFCRKSFSNNKALTLHVRTHTTGERPYQCTYCDMSYTQKSNLTVHVRTHSEERPYQCTYCDMSFTLKSNLTVHIRTHTGERPYQCSYCDMSYIHKSNLTMHIRTHTGERPYQCSYCHKSFVSNCNLASHLRTFSGRKSHSCTSSVTSVADKGHLDVDKSFQPIEAPYTCIFCDQSFYHESDLSSHAQSSGCDKKFCIIVVTNEDE